MTKKYYFLNLALAFIFSLQGCGGGKDELQGIIQKQNQPEKEGITITSSNESVVDAVPGTEAQPAPYLKLSNDSDTSAFTVFVKDSKKSHSLESKTHFFSIAQYQDKTYRNVEIDLETLFPAQKVVIVGKKERTQKLPGWMRTQSQKDFLQWLTSVFRCMNEIGEESEVEVSCTGAAASNLYNLSAKNMIRDKSLHFKELRVFQTFIQTQATGGEKILIGESPIFDVLQFKGFVCKKKLSSCTFYLTQN